MIYGFYCLWHALLSYILIILILIKSVYTKIDEDTILISHFLVDGFTRFRSIGLWRVIDFNRSCLVKNQMIFFSEKTFCSLFLLCWLLTNIISFILNLLVTFWLIRTINLILSSFARKKFESFKENHSLDS